MATASQTRCLCSQGRTVLGSREGRTRSSGVRGTEACGGEKGFGAALLFWVEDDAEEEEEDGWRSS